MLSIIGGGWAIYVKVSKPLGIMRQQILVAATRNLTRGLDEALNDQWARSRNFATPRYVPRTVRNMIRLRRV